MRMSDWSSDGCSSDLDENASGTVLGRKAQGSFRILAAGDTIFGAFDAVVHGITDEVREGLAETLDHGLVEFGMLAGYFQLHVLGCREVGRASCRERVCQYGYLTVVAV